MNFSAVLRRAFVSNLGTVTPSESERAGLEASGISEPTLQRFLVWRKATVLMVVVATVLSAGLSTFLTFTEDDEQPAIIDTITATVLKKLEGTAPTPGSVTPAEATPATEPAGADESDDRSAMGVFADSVELLSLYALPIAALIVLFLRERLKLSFKVMVIAFVFSFIMPLLLALCPWSWWGIEDEILSPTADPVKYLQNEVEGVLEGVAYMAMLLPAVLSLVPGVVKACLRVKTLLPQSLLSGWFVVVAAPLYGLFLLVAFVAIDQFISDPLLLCGIVLLALSFFVYVVHASAFTRPLLVEADFQRMRKAQMIVTALTVLGGGLAVAYLMTREFMGVHLVGPDPTSSLMRPMEIVAFLLQTISRGMFVTALGADLFVRLNLTAWRQNRDVAGSGTSAAYEGAMEALDARV